MAGLAAVTQVGESLVTMLRARRDLLAAGGQLAPVPAALDISHASLSRLATPPEPTTGCTLTCYRVMMSDYPRQPGLRPDQAAATTISVDLHYLMTAWSSNVAEEQAIISWAMLELAAHPLLDRSILPSDGSWASGETVQIVPDSLSDDALFRLWAALQHKYRLSTTFVARVVRIGFGPQPDYPPVVASRFGFAGIDDALVPEGQ